MFLLAWFAVLGVGLRIEANSTSNLMLYLMSSTVTNVGMLAILASLVGEPDEWGKSIRRGFTVFVSLMAGVIVLFTQTVEAPTPEQYAKLAGSISLACVLCSYQPDLFDSFVDRVASVFKGPLDG